MVKTTLLWGHELNKYFLKVFANSSFTFERKYRVKNTKGIFLSDSIAGFQLYFEQPTAFSIQTALNWINFMKKRDKLVQWFRRNKMKKVFNPQYSNFIKPSIYSMKSTSQTNKKLISDAS